MFPLLLKVREHVERHSVHRGGTPSYPRSRTVRGRMRAVSEPGRRPPRGKQCGRLSTEGRTKLPMRHVVHHSVPGRKLAPTGSPFTGLRCRPATPRWLTAPVATNVRRTELTPIPRGSHRERDRPWTPATD